MCITELRCCQAPPGLVVNAPSNCPRFNSWANSWWKGHHPEIGWLRFHNLIWDSLRVREILNASVRHVRLG